MPLSLKDEWEVTEKKLMSLNGVFLMGGSSITEEYRAFARKVHGFVKDLNS